MLATAAPLIHSAALTIGGHQPLLSNQSAFSNEIAAIGVWEPVMKSLDPDPSSLLSTLPSRPLSFLINLFHLVAFTESAISTTSFPDSPTRDSASVNCTGPCPHLAGKCHFHSCCNNGNLAAACRDICHCKRSVMERTKTRLCHRTTSPNQHPVFSRYLSSSAQLSLASESVISPWITSPLPDTRNASFLFLFRTLVKPV